ncbi:chromate efflux transporter [Limnochorda pilosa]|uniref:ChrA protein n=1 Tax=Limnochorda pilosa TaxID=1555112 RepID=A0A0K2SHW8_LIMPI|nr:chromate efflux transporter [Limnochorda pilosa]BAS26711.1 ChrA protein [Limnochorda pilosa]
MTRDRPPATYTPVAAPATPGSVPAGSRLPVLLELLGVTLRLGLTSFGGPIAHLGYFHQEYVVRRRWLDEGRYADLVALCQFLPGPASSQVGIAVGMLRAGLLGGIVSWLGFTLPSAVALALFARTLQGADITGSGWLRGLLIVAVAVVAQAVWSMGKSLAPDRERATLAVAAAVVTLTWPSAVTQVAVIAAAGVLGWALLPRDETPGGPAATAATGLPSRRGALVASILFFGLLVGLPLLRALTGIPALAVLESFYRAGSLVFGGGHVVLPLLQSAVVPPGWVSDAQFLAGYGAAQAVPGPLFTFSAYLGTAMGGWAYGALALVAVFLPSFFLVAGALPFWEGLRRRAGIAAALRGVNAGVVGILLAALYEPIWTKAILAPPHVAPALVAFALLSFWKVPPWAVVVFSALVGTLLPRVE